MFSAALKSCLRLSLGAVPTRFYQRLFPRDVIGLCYHMVTDEYPPHVAHISPYKTAAQFQADLKYLKQNYEIINYEELCERRAGSGAEKEVSGVRCQVSGNGVPRTVASRRPAVLITFDDGLRQHLTVVKPLLEKHGIPAIFFITTDFLNNQRLFYRHKVSLCIESAQQRSDEEVATILNEFAHASESQSHPASSIQHQIEMTNDQAPMTNGGEGVEDSKSQEAHRFPIEDPVTRSPSPATRYPQPVTRIQDPRDSFIRWIKRLTYFDEPTIDVVCERLGVDCQRFLDEQRPYLTTDEVLSLADAGFTIGAHSVTHTRLSDLLGTEQRAEGEEPGAKSPEERVESTEKRAEGPERRAESPEPRVESKEQQAENSLSLSPLISHFSPNANACHLSPGPSHLTPFDSELVDSCRIVAELTGKESVPFAFPFSGDGVPRAGLAAIRDNHPQVGIIFDRRGFRADAQFVVHRIIADRPPASEESSSSNLPSLIRREYVREARGRAK